MPHAEDTLEKIKADERELQERKKAAIEALLKRRAEQNREIDKQLAALGYRADGVKQKRSHHKRPAPTAEKANT
jgi:hypothetical protein